MSIVIEMVQSTHIQYITNYFIKFCNYLNHFKSIFALCNILLHVLFYQKYIFQSFNINKKCSFLWHFTLFDNWFGGSWKLHNFEKNCMCDNIF
jgi:hypothetical protein